MNSLKINFYLTEMMKALKQYKSGELALFNTDSAWWPVKIREYQRQKKRLVVLFLDKEPSAM